MTVVPYLLRLTTRLASQTERIPAEARLRHVAYLLAAQNADGGFPGRQGGSDLYYTGFALRSLAIMDALTRETCERVGGFLSKSLQQQASVVDFFSLLYTCFLVQAGGGPNILEGSPPSWPERVAATLEGFRSSDGGYGKSAGTGSGSTYHSFLVSLCHELLGKELPNRQDLLRFVLSRRREDGGFVEISAMRRSGTNPTAAAVGLLDILQPEPSSEITEIRTGVTAFLLNMVSQEGGFRANERAPLADLLSTFTTVWTLDQLGGLPQLEKAAPLRFVQALERPEGGFHGGLWDDGHDVEYTFYGLGALALLTP